MKQAKSILILPVLWTAETKQPFIPYISFKYHGG